MSLRAVIVDDEPLGRQAIRDCCARHRDVEVAAECATAIDAIDLIRREKPDVAFLDVQMKPMTGLELVKELGPDDLPVVVFVTAYDRYAVRAFELNAVDYLLKPFDGARFEATLERVRERCGERLPLALKRDLRETLVAMVRDITGERAPAQPESRLILEIEGRVHFVEPTDIEYVEADGNYVGIHVGDRTHTVRCPIGELEERLAAPRFLRIHRSVIVNTARIRSMEKWFHGEYVVQMQGGREFTSGRTYRQRIQGFLLRGKGAHD